ncbi:MAG: RNA polymerase sigma-70 factor [Gemmatimonadota bacterium]|nr:RNA polymerase sigma-70 factor [Gemmatimonadota bacterium]
MALTPDTLTDITLAQIRAGERDAFELLFRCWYGRLASYAASLTRNRDGAEDVVQELFVTLWNKRESLPDLEKLPAYLHRATRNRALNQLRSQRTAGKWLATQDADPATPAVAESELLGQEVAARIKAALAALAPRSREIFLLNRDQGLTYVAIAETLRISAKTVETLMSRSLKALRLSLADLVDPAEP